MFRDWKVLLTLIVAIIISIGLIRCAPPEEPNAYSDRFEKLCGFKAPNTGDPLKYLNTIDVLFAQTSKIYPRRSDLTIRVYFPRTDETKWIDCRQLRPSKAPKDKIEKTNAATIDSIRAREDRIRSLEDRLEIVESKILELEKSEEELDWRSE